MEVAATVAAGALLGVVTGLIPGLHVNTIAAVGLAVMPHGGLPAALGLLAVGTVHTIVNILPNTYLGVPGEDDALTVLPAHRMLLRGLGPEAVHASVAASLAAVIVAVGLALAYLLFLRASTPWLDAAAAALLLLTLAWLLFGEARRQRRFLLYALFVQVAAGAWGWLSLQVPLRALVGVPASPLLPLLGGLFGAAGLTFALKVSRVIPTQNPPRRRTRDRAPMIMGIGVAAVTAVMPGLTAAAAGSFIPGLRQHPRRIIAALSAVNTAHAIFALIVWLSLGRIRTGLAASADYWTEATWLAKLPPPDVAIIFASVVVAGALGAVATLAINRAIAPHVHKVPGRTMAGFGLASILLLTIVLTGWAGLVILAGATLVGRLPLHLGVRRVHLVVALIAPILLRLLEF